jgi:hypothetical protein
MRSFLGLGVLVVLGVAGCDGHTSVSGRITDPKGKPLPEAAVKLIQQTGHPRSSTTTSDEEGRFSVGVTHAPTKSMPFVLEVTKEGFEKHAERLLGTAHHEREITLQPASK